MSNEFCITLGMLLASVTLAESDFTATPGVIKRDVGQSASLQWTLSVPFNITASKAEMEIFASGSVIVEYTQRHGSCNKYGDNRLSCIVPDSIGKEVGFEITGITREDAKTYACSVTYNQAGNVVGNNNAVLYVFATPTVKIQGSTSGEEGSSITLNCEATSQSVPQGSSTPEFEYVWDINNEANNHVISGSTVTIPSLVGTNNKATFKCSVVEKTSTVTPGIDTVTLDVKYRPSAPTISGIPTYPLIEGEDALSMTCELNNTYPGNPLPHVYHWRNNNSTFVHETLGNKLELSGTTLTASNHDGHWQCQAENIVGNSSNANIRVVVNARPELDPNLPASTTAVADILDSLQVTCGFTSKPGVTVSWTYNGGPLKQGVRTNRLTPQQNYPYTTVRYELLWDDDSSLSSKRAAGGKYKCEATVDIGSGPEKTSSREMDLTVEYKPYDIRLTGGGQTHTAIAGQSEPVTRTCVADCVPGCNYKWEDGEGNPISNTAMLNFDPVQKDHHGTYMCYATNKHNRMGITTDFILNVNYIPEIDNFVSSIDKPVQPQEVTLTCDISSRPESNNTVMFPFNNTILTSSRGYQVKYTFNSVQCLDTGNYLCEAINVIGQSLHGSLLYMDVQCPYSPENVNTTVGKSVGENHTFSQILTANPSQPITRTNWTFTPKNDTLQIISLPDNVGVTLTPSNHVVQTQLQLTIWQIEEANFGLYSMTAENGVGNAATISFRLEPQGPPSSPSVPSLVHGTSVALDISWSAGFNGGFVQTFTILYTNLDISEEYTKSVDTDADTSTGEVIEYRLRDPSSVLPDTSYEVRIRAENPYNGGSQVIGPPSTLKTDPESGLKTDSDPVVSIDEDTKQIVIVLDMMNPQYLSHVEIVVCAQESPDGCMSHNVTDLTSDIITIPSPDPDADVFSFVLTMFDGEVDVFIKEWMYTIKKRGSPLPLIIGGVVGGLVLATLIVIAVVILVRKGVIPKKVKEREENGYDQQGEHSHYGEDNNAVFDDAVPAYATSADITGPSTRVGQQIDRDEITDEYAVVNKKRGNQNGFNYSTAATDKKTQPDEVTDVYAVVTKPRGNQKANESSSTTGMRPVSVFPPPSGSSSDPPPVYAEVKKPSNVATVHGRDGGDGGRDRPNPAEKKGWFGGRKRADKSDQKDVVHAGQQYANVQFQSDKDGAYSEVKIDGLKIDGPKDGTYYNVGVNMETSLNKYIDEDGLQYALLDQVALNTEAEEAAARGEEPKIHGLENRTDYALIDYNKLVAKGKKKK